MSGTRTARARATPKPRPLPKTRPAGPPAPLEGWRRWGWIAALVTFALVGLPLAHAIFGEVAALFGATGILGFLLGRWTAR